MVQWPVAWETPKLSAPVGCAALQSSGRLVGSSRAQMPRRGVQLGLSTPNIHAHMHTHTHTLGVCLSLVASPRGGWGTLVWLLQQIPKAWETVGPGPLKGVWAERQWHHSCPCLCGHVASSLCPRVPWVKGPPILQQDLTLMNYICNNPISKYSHLLRYWDLKLGLEYIF